MENLSVKVRDLGPKERKFLEGLIEGKSFRSAALDAGFSVAMAEKARLKILPRVQEPFFQALESRLPMAKLAQRLIDGLDAYETKIATHEGQITDSRDFINWTERREYAETLAKICGFIVDRKEVNAKIDVDYTHLRERITRLASVLRRDESARLTGS